MSNNKPDFPGYKIQIGNEDIIKTKVLSLIPEGSSTSETDDSKAEKKLNEVLKETRVRVGTLLKTDNVSFLMGAGTSIPAGGISLANIPRTLEKKLLEIAFPENTVSSESYVPAWIKYYYETVSFLSGNHCCFCNRIAELQAPKKNEMSPIYVNFEHYLSNLHMWLSSMRDQSVSLKIRRSEANNLLRRCPSKSGELIRFCSLKSDELILEKAPLEILIKHITGHLIDLMNLPIPDKKDELNVHRKFIKKILTRPLNLRRVNIFTLNYDTLIEQGADSEGVVLVDGFVGNLKRIFRPESYDLDFYFPAQTTEGRVHRFDRALHLYKLHGSITWHKTDQGWENPYGLYSTFFDQDNKDDDVLIYPSPLKYGQALGLPYSELFRRFGNSVVQPQSVLFTIGYGFGDEHVNAIIRQSLAVPSFTLVIVDPNPSSDFVKELMEIGDERVWIVSGSILGRFENFVEHLLPDLREEEISAKVMQTFKKLTKENTFEETEDGK